MITFGCVRYCINFVKPQNYSKTLLKNIDLLYQNKIHVTFTTVLRNTAILATSLIADLAAQYSSRSFLNIGESSIV